MGLGKKLKKIEDLKRLDINIVNCKAYLNFHTGVNGRRYHTQLKPALGAIEGKYIKASLIAFHDAYDIEHDSMNPPINDEYCINKTSHLQIDFKKIPFLNDDGKTKMKVLKHTLWIHESLQNQTLLFRVQGQGFPSKCETSEKQFIKLEADIVWDTKYCETIVPPFPDFTQ